MNKTCTLKSNKSKCLKGIISVPPDKSISQRALILSAICMGNSKIYNLLESEDVLNTLKSIEKLGLKIEKKKCSMKFMEPVAYLKILKII
ncbi:MAG: hypothetical protein CMN01_00540 [Rickettsiales bacterium]|nr:hypothetical protein [Rickettsiales bacterium]